MLVFFCMCEKYDYRFILPILLTSTARYTVTQMSQSRAYLTSVGPTEHGPNVGQQLLHREGLF
jgi:hypothetical protein